VCAGGAGFEKLRRRLVDVVNDGEALEGRLPRTRAAADFQPVAVRDAPREGEHLNLVLVFGVDRLALDVADLRKDVGGHRDGQYTRRTSASGSLS
jgi:hypothetical protein